MSSKAEAFDRWIRSGFVSMNTELEELYFSQPDRANVEGVGERTKAAMRDEGRAFVVDLLREGNTGDGFDSGFSVLGSVGLYMGALRRHELTHPDREERSPFPEASSLALHVGASLGMAPRFATSHLTTHNHAVGGLPKSFTTLPDERLFLHENTRAIFGFQRAADALTHVVSVGVTSPVADTLLQAARDALQDVIRCNERLFSQLDVDRFFYNVRPYYKPYRVGRFEFRGANAGDFSGINEIDLLLGLCQANDTYYAQLLVDKMLFMLPADQARLRECMTRRSLLDEFLRLLDSTDAARGAHFAANATGYLEICDLYARTASQHHDQLVSRFIEHPARSLDARHMQGLTASGPPLPVLLRALETLRDLRCAAQRPDLATRHADLARLRAAFTSV
ncbi:MAG: monodechloroaminopyrrolnitrin synthase PrnB family protein [Steroidobacteraceae bacterium]